jgi:steroid delta-isomerase-like uncharacterized protein
MSEQNKTLVRRLIEEHWNAKNVSLVSEFFAPTVALETSDGSLAGTEGAALLLHAYINAFPDFRVGIDDMVAEGDQVAVRWTFSGTHRGAYADVPGTGKRVNVPNVIGIFRVADGKVVEGHLCWDRYALLEQVGAVAGKAAAREIV